MRNPNPAFGDSDFLFAASQSRLIAERRYDRLEYDTQSVSSLLLPNGSKCSSLSRPFNNAASAEVLRLWREGG